LAFTDGVPHEVIKLSNMRKTIARRLTESKQQIPHIYLTLDARLDALLKLRGELNAGLVNRGMKLSVNDMLIKALALALTEVPECNVSFSGDQLIKYHRADISVAVSIPNGLITPIIAGAEDKSLSKISTQMQDLAARAKEGKLQPNEYQGGTASLSNMGMFGIKHFEAVINPPQAMIMAIGAGEKRPYVIDDSLQIATVMSATGSFDHRAIDGADGARLMKAFKELIESPLGLVAWDEVAAGPAPRRDPGLCVAAGVRRHRRLLDDQLDQMGNRPPHSRIAGIFILDSAVPGLGRGSSALLQLAQPLRK
jgi:pyruvate dehydrogenase E2 component (dihydrolipoamide acetyltransferase)